MLIFFAYNDSSIVPAEKNRIFFKKHGKYVR